jgi:hypothetical protein
MAKGGSTMTSNISAAQIVGDTLYLDLEGVIDDPVLRRIADCVRELGPTIDQNIARHGLGTTLVALVAIVANEAIDAGSGRLIAEAFRHNAEMLELREASVPSLATHDENHGQGRAQRCRSTSTKPLELTS